jgi:hypothetical protein
VRQNLPSRRRSASQHEAEAPGPGPDTATERAILASIFENPREALERPSLRWLCANAPRSFSDPLVGAAAAEVHRQGLEANLASVIQSLEAAEQITADARGYLVSLAAEALPVDLAEADAARLVETRRPAQLAATLREAADQIEHIPQRAPEILGVMRETIDTLDQEGPGAIETPLALAGLPDPREPVEVPFNDLARVAAELRARGLVPWAMDIRRGSYLLHLRRAPDPTTTNQVASLPPTKEGTYDRIPTNQH